ncbi:MAG: sugar ABC transporter ATP-binding protein [Ilumatobacteraceae bacterium]
MSGLRVEHATKRFGAQLALDDVSMTVRPGAIHALLGGNGSGKSTLIKLLAGVHRADNGRLVVGSASFDLTRHTPGEAARTGLRFVHQSLGIFPGLSVAENLALGHGYRTTRAGRVDWPAQRASALASIDRFHVDATPNTPAGALRPADQALLAIARALGNDDAAASVLVLDEPTASLPRLEVEVLFASLRRHRDAGRTILLVTHRLDEVLELADHLTILRDGRVVEERATAGLDHDHLVECIAGAPVRTAPRSARTGREEAVVEIENAAVGPLRQVDLTVRRGEVVGIAGLLGSGRTELLEAMAGIRRWDRGSVVLRGEPYAPREPRDAIAAGVVYVPEDRPGTGVFTGETLRQNLHAGAVRHYWRRGRLDGRAERRDARELVHRFGVRAAHEELAIEALSGGNQQKVVIARWLRHDPRLVLLDEPTQGIDVRARHDIQRLVRERAEHGSGVVYVSSDFEELAETCDRVVVIVDGAVGQNEVRAPRITAAVLVSRCYSNRSVPEEASR